MSFSIGLLVGKLIKSDVFNVACFNMGLPDELCLIWETLCTDTAIKGDIPGLVV